MTKFILKTTMFDIAGQRGLTLKQLSSQGHSLYSPNYLYKIVMCFVHLNSNLLINLTPQQ